MDVAPGRRAHPQPPEDPVEGVRRRIDADLAPASDAGQAAAVPADPGADHGRADRSLCRCRTTERGRTLASVAGRSTAEWPVRNPAHQEDPDTMTLGTSVEVPVAPAQLLDLLAELDRLRGQVRWAEDKVANLERGLASNRRIGIAVGILMCRYHASADQAFALLRTHSQRHNVKVRELAETVICTGRL
jgi:hypothetical protein